MLDEAPRPAGSQYGIDPVEKRIVSDVYGLPGDLLLSGRVPFDAGIRQALGPQTVGYGAVVVHKDAIEFVGAARNPGMAKWKQPKLPSSMSVTRRIRDLRTTDSLKRLANAVLEHDGYLWRLGLRGFELDAERFKKLLGESPQRTAAQLPVEEPVGQGGESDDSGGRGRFIGTVPDIVPCGIAEGPTLIVARLGGNQIGQWQRWRLLTNAALLPYDKRGVQTALCKLGSRAGWSEDEKSRAYAQIEERLTGWSLIVRATAMGDHLRTFLRETEDMEAFRSTATVIDKQLWPTDVIEHAREKAEEYLRVIQEQDNTAGVE